MNKLTLLIVMTVIQTTCALAQNLKEIALPTPSKDRGASVMKALADRHSVRECAGKELSLTDLSDAIWAANGINRPEEGKRTAPSALNKQDIDIYVFNAQGVYLYQPEGHKLVPVLAGDHRKALAGPPSPARTQDYVVEFPVILLYVSDLSRFGEVRPTNQLYAAMDAGIVSENVNLFCAATGLCTVPRASMDMPAVRKLLKLNENQIALLNNPIGYPKE